MSRSSEEITERLRANRAAMFAYCAPKIGGAQDKAQALAELDRQLTIVKWAQAVASAPSDQVIDAPDGYSAEEIDSALFGAMYRQKNTPPLIAGGQGRENVETHRAGLFFVLVLLISMFAVFVGLCFAIK